MPIADQCTVKERLRLANRQLQFANMLHQGEVGFDGRFGDWRNVESRKGLKLALISVFCGVVMACGFFSLLALGGVL